PPPTTGCAWCRLWPICVFFFQAEDGIRDRNVTGVQTCALPICFGVPHSRRVIARSGDHFTAVLTKLAEEDGAGVCHGGRERLAQIGRASCRERVEVAVGDAAVVEKCKERVDSSRKVVNAMMVYE